MIEGRFPLPTLKQYQNQQLSRGLKKRVKTTHPNIYKIIDEFKKEKEANEVKIVQY